MKLSAKSFIYKFLKITGLSIAAVLLLLFLAPIVFPGTVSEKIKQWTNESLAGELNFSKARLSFFKHFPSLTLTLYDFSLKGSAPFRKDTLVAAEEVAFGIDLSSLIFNKSIHIDKIFVSEAYMNVEVNEKGEANYNVYVSDKKKKADSDTSGGTALKLEKIIIENSHLLYNDKSLPLRINARGFNYTGKGDLSKAVFDLYSHVRIDSFDFSFNHERYLQHKKIDAALITKINTNSLAFFFQKNDLLINRLPVEFSGKLDFLPNGYDIDFTVNSDKTKLSDFITAFPPQYGVWLQKATVKGTTDLSLTLKGPYIAAQNRMPDLAYSMDINDGYISYENSPLPASNLLLRMNARMPSLNPDSLQLNIDTLNFNIEKDYFRGALHTKGLDRPAINAKIDAEMDLQKLDQAFGFESFDMKGKYQFHLEANGVYAKGPDPNSLRHDSILLSIPSFTVQSKMKNGYFKYLSLPQAITGIGFSLDASCYDGNYKSMSVTLNDLQAQAGSDFIRGFITLKGIGSPEVQAHLQSEINLANIKKLVPLDSMELGGILKLAIDSRGYYNKGMGTFPPVNATINLQNGLIQSKYYPHPISNIQLMAHVADGDGSFKDLSISIQPASFEFEGKPFTVQASLKNFDDIAYDIKAKGTLDLEKIYQVFSQKGVDVSGFINADLSLQGRQSDALHGRYSLLHNEGSLEVNNIKTSYEAFPQPFVIKRGLFRFKQEKMWFSNFTATYGQSDFNLDGYLQNVIEYTLGHTGTLKGNFTLTSDFINAGELMAFAPPAGKKPADSMQARPVGSVDSETGVIIVPSNLSLTLSATAKKVSYNGMEITNATGHLTVDSGKLSLAQTGFSLIGCQMLMDAHYGSLSPRRAVFDYHLQAKDFDINKAWREIKLFHDMASSAGKAYGVVSLDYNLKGKLDSTMHPVYPSLEGGGTLSLTKVKVKGLKLFTAMGKESGKDGLADPDLSKVDIKTTIKNNIITLERLKMKIAGFRPRIEGQVSLDGRLNLKIRLGLPPLGIIGIPMRVTGTQENPQFKLGKSDKDEIPETEDKEN